MQTRTAEIPVVRTVVTPAGYIWSATAGPSWDLLGIALDATAPAELARLLDLAEVRQSARRYTDAARLYRQAEELGAIDWFASEDSSGRSWPAAPAAVVAVELV